MILARRQHGGTDDGAVVEQHPHLAARDQRRVVVDIAGARPVSGIVVVRNAHNDGDIGRDRRTDARHADWLSDGVSDQAEPFPGYTLKRTYKMSPSRIT